MKTELIEISPTRREIKIELDADKVREANDRISDRYAKMANVPGFRRGNTPVSVIRTRYRNEIRGEVLQELVPTAVQAAIQEHQLLVIGEPDVHLENDEGLKLDGTEPVHLHAHVEILPAVELGEYKNFEAARRTRPVTEEDVERVIEGLREASAALQPVEDRPSQTGDTVTVDVHGVFVDEPEAEPINVTEVDVVLGGEGVQQEFTDNLTGVQVDDEKKFTVPYPADFTSPGLAGKTIDYTAKVTAVRIKELPELDDEWAKSLGEEYESLDLLREKVREDLTSRSRHEAENRMRGEVMNKLVDAHQFEVPESLIEYQADQLLESVARDMMMRGVDPRMQQAEWWEGVREQLKPQATRDLRGSMLLESIADREQIEVSDEEIAAEISSIAAQSRRTADEVRDALTKQGGERSIADRLRNRKALDLVVENARVTDEEWKDEEPAAESDESDNPESESTAEAASSDS
ncbi:MAG: trigger factor [Acidobacteria bacterium]|nr:trigger factor [Acidobacteriota bacterium]